MQCLITCRCRNCAQLFWFKEEKVKVAAKQLVV